MECSRCHTPLPETAAYCQACGARQAGVMEHDTFEYAAFISYRHIPQDQEIALKVQRAIETYKLPKGLKAFGGGTNEHKLGKCFRDEDELPAAHSLPDRIAEALAKSRALVVICSPETPRSPWIRREIETFAQLHGRERIFAVLASGSSADSIPDLLKTRLTVDASGEATAIPSGPLAADLRPSAAGRSRIEKLRIIASVAGCGFDDLRQRERTRARRRITTFVAGAIAIALLIGALAFAAHSSRQDALVSESLRLASESQQLLARGDRYGAIEAALAGLPSSGNDASRPATPEAQQALEDALQVHPTTDTCWRPDYSIQTAHTLSLLENGMIHEADTETSRASAFAYDPTQDSFAISDDEGQIATYDAKTGRELSRCEMPASAQPLADGLYVRNLTAIGGRLVVSNAGSSPTVACFDSQTGNIIWSYDNVAFPAMSASSDGTILNVAQPQVAGGLATASVNMSDGQAVAACDLADTAIPQNAQSVVSVIGNWTADYYVAIGDALVYVDQSTSESHAAALSRNQVSSLDYGYGTLITTTEEQMPENGIERGYSIEAFDSDLNRLWHYDGTTATQMLVNGTLKTLLDGSPRIAGYALGGTQVVISAGRTFLVLDRKTGDVLQEQHMNQTIVGAQVFDDAEAGLSDLVIACSDGTVTVFDLTGDTLSPDGDAMRLELSFPIRWAHAHVLDNRLCVLVAPADATDQIVAYHTDFTHGEELGDYDLDGLIALAHDVLREAGRTQ